MKVSTYVSDTGKRPTTTSLKRNEEISKSRYTKKKCRRGRGNKMSVTRTQTTNEISDSIEVTPYREARRGRPGSTRELQPQRGDRTSPSTSPASPHPIRKMVRGKPFILRRCLKITKRSLVVVVVVVSRSCCCRFLLLLLLLRVERKHERCERKEKRKKKKQKEKKNQEKDFSGKIFFLIFFFLSCFLSFLSFLLLSFFTHSFFHSMLPPSFFYVRQ